MRDPVRPVILYETTKGRASSLPLVEHSCNVSKQTLPTGIVMDGSASSVAILLLPVHGLIQ